MNQKTVSKMILTAAAALALTACNKENLENNLAEMRLAINLNTQLEEGETVHIWVDDSSTGEPLYSNTPLTTDSEGALTGGGTMHFPSPGNSADIYAIHGNFGTADLTNFWGTEQIHTVSRDQKTGSSGLALSDLVFAKRKNVSPTSDHTIVNMTFTRLLSKVEVVLMEGMGDPTVTKVEILNTRLEAKFTPSKTENFSVSASGSRDPIETDTFLTPAADASGTDESNEMLNEAFIVPQTLAAGTEFIRITIAGGKTFIYNLPSDETFEPGGRYRFTITVENPIGDKKAESAEVGDWFMSDGTVLSQEKYLTPELASNIIGIVFYKGQHEKDNSDYSGTGIGQAECHGYAVALTDVNNDTDDRLAWESGPNGEYDKEIGTSTDETDWSGYANKLLFHEYAQAHSTEGWEMKHFPAAYACELYGNRTVDRDGNPTQSYDWQQGLAAPGSTSGWFLPAAGQLKYLYDNSDTFSTLMEVVKKHLMDNCSHKDHVKWFNHYAFSEDPTSYYWTSTEDEIYAQVVCFGVSPFYSGGYTKLVTCCVRAILAF